MVGPKAVHMTVSLGSSVSRCPRCQGKMFPQSGSADRACFTCGHVIYELDPLTLTTRVRRRRQDASRPSENERIEEHAMNSS